MQLSQSANDSFVQCGLVLHAQRGVLSRHAMQHVGNFLFVAVARGFQSKAKDRLREVQRLEMNVIVFLRIVQNGVEVDVIDLGDSDDVSRHGGIHFHVILALQPVQVRHLERLAGIADKQLRIRRHRSLMHAEYAELADKWVDFHLEYVCENVF